MPPAIIAAIIGAASLIVGKGADVGINKGKGKRAKEQAQMQLAQTVLNKPKPQSNTVLYVVLGAVGVIAVVGLIIYAMSAPKIPVKTV